MTRSTCSACCAAMVVGYHYGLRFHHAAPPACRPRRGASTGSGSGWVGVELFFVFRATSSSPTAERRDRATVRPRTGAAAGPRRVDLRHDYRGAATAVPARYRHRGARMGRCGGIHAHRRPIDGSLLDARRSRSHSTPYQASSRWVGTERAFGGGVVSRRNQPRLLDDAGRIRARSRLPHTRPHADLDATRRVLCAGAVPTSIDQSWSWQLAGFSLALAWGCCFEIAVRRTTWRDYIGGSVRTSRSPCSCGRRRRCARGRLQPGMVGQSPQRTPIRLGIATYPFT